MMMILHFVSRRSINAEIIENDEVKRELNSLEPRPKWRKHLFTLHYSFLLDDHLQSPRSVKFFDVHVLIN